MGVVCGSRRATGGAITGAVVSVGGMKSLSCSIKSFRPLDATRYGQDGFSPSGTQTGPSRPLEWRYLMKKMMMGALVLSCTGLVGVAGAQNSCNMPGMSGGMGGDKGVVMEASKSD